MTSMRIRPWMYKAALAAAAVVLFFLTKETWIHAFKVATLSAGLTLILTPLCTRIERKGINRSTAALFSLTLFVMVFVFFLLVFVPYLVAGIIDFARRITPTVLKGLEQINLILRNWGMNDTLMLDSAQILMSALSPVTAGLAKGSAAIVSAAGNIALSIVIAYYFLTVRDHLTRHILLLVPVHMRETVISALQGCRNAVLSYLSGTLKTSAFVGATTLIGLLLLDIKDALILAFFMGAFEVLPYIGPVLAAIPILLAAVPLGAVKTLLSLLLVLIVQQLEAGVVGPYFTASSTSIHPLLAIIGVFLGGSLFGIPGILLTIPVFIVIRSMIWSIRSAAIHFDS